MNLSNLIKYGLMAICISGNALAMDDKESKDGLLIVGCRPWDQNIQDIKGLEKAHFVDRMIHLAPNPVPATFHHYDLNEVGAYSVVNQYYNGPLAGKFSEFAKAHSGEYKTIIIDWMTCHHIGENQIDAAWQGFSTLLNKGGMLIIPVAVMNFGSSVSREKATALETKLIPLFGEIKFLKHNELPMDECFDLLRRPGITDAALSMDPVIIFAIK